MRSIERAIQEAAVVRPAARQVAWQKLETIGFVHFGMNTFTDREWGEGTESPQLFNPTALDARQWAQVFKDAGLRLLILTAKHHDGFCLWPSRWTEHSVKNSPWRSGKGDVVREVADACRAVGIQFGVYLSPWDRHEPSYGDSPRYNEHFCNQLRELLANYGPIGEVWFDGACAEGPNGKRQRYEWASYYKLIRELQPEAAIAICGPDVRWVGNESGLGRRTEWSVVGVNHDFENSPGLDFNEAFYNQQCNMDGRELPDHAHAGAAPNLARAASIAWWPSECDVSIRPGWFYHAAEDLRVKSVAELMEIYYQSVGRNSVLLLNIPPDRRGLIHEHDAQRLRDWRRVIDATFAENLAEGAKAKRTANSVELELAAPATFDRLCLQEDIREGQRIAEFVFEAWHDGAWKEILRGTTVGYKKLERFGSVTASRIRLTLPGSRAEPKLTAIGLFAAPGA